MVESALIASDREVQRHNELGCLARAIKRTERLLARSQSNLDAINDGRLECSEEEKEKLLTLRAGWERKLNHQRGQLKSLCSLM